MPFCGSMSTYTQSGRSGKLSGETLLEEEGRQSVGAPRGWRSHKPTDRFVPSITVVVWNGCSRVQNRVHFVFIWCANTHTRVYVCAAAALYNLFWVPSSSTTVSKSRQGRDWPSLGGVRGVTTTDFSHLRCSWADALNEPLSYSLQN